MFIKLISLAVTILFVTQTHALSRKRIYPTPKISLDSINPEKVGDPLILTPYLKQGKIDEAQKLSKVTNLTDVLSYSGYFTVNETYNSNMFFWFFPAQFNAEKAPVVLWLQGGPGGSSLFGLFVENGPFIIDQNQNIQLRSTSWSLTHSVLYLDNPVGTGFSFTEDNAGYARNEVDVADGLYSALVQFYTLFPQYQPLDFYATGESYAGKYVPAISHRIHLENQKSPEVKINLKGMAIGDGWSDPVNMLYYSEYLYNVGLLDWQQKKVFEKQEALARNYIKKGNFIDAFTTVDELMDGDLTPYPSYFQNFTGLKFYFNFMIAVSPPDMDYYSPFVQTEAVRRSIHVGSKPYNDGSTVEKNMRNDMYHSVADKIAAILDAPEKYKVLVYSGQLDIIVANILTERFLYKLKWHGSTDWENAERRIWRVAGDVAGYCRSTDNLQYVLVRNAGHMVPYDQPKWSFDLINRFTTGKPFA